MSRFIRKKNLNNIISQHVCMYVYVLEISEGIIVFSFGFGRCILGLVFFLKLKLSTPSKKEIRMGEKRLNL